MYPFLSLSDLWCSWVLYIYIFSFSSFVLFVCPSFPVCDEKCSTVHTHTALEICVWTEKNEPTTTTYNYETYNQQLFQFFFFFFRFCFFKICLSFSSFEKSKNNFFVSLFMITIHLYSQQMRVIDILNKIKFGSMNT